MPSDQDEMDMENFQRLSDNYQPDVQGPLIRHRHPIQTLMSEFSNADPAYVTKTAALAASYSQYRPVKGDGQCGWRAVVFGYFESLMYQSAAKITLEKARIQSFNDTLVAVGYDFSMVELFVDETMELFESLHRMIESGDMKDDLLLDVFNDESRSNSIVFHFKLLTSATMKLNPEQYQPYLEQPLFEYCQSNVDAFGQEIEQISLQALTDGVIAPAHISVVVMYLDRSEGGEVTPHHLVANAGSQWPTITLLYRPGHYDMIYKAAPLQAHRVEFGASQNDFISTNGFGFGSRTSDLRVLSRLNEDQSMMHHYQGEQSSPFSHQTNVPHAHYATAVTGQKNAADFSEVSTISTGPPASVYEPAYMPVDISATLFQPAHNGYKVLTPESSYKSFTSTSPSFSPYCHPPMLLPPQQYCSPPAMSPAHSISPGQGSRKQELQIRMSQPCFEMGQRHHEILPLETGPFKNSPFNRGHFANPDFQPMMWKAEEDYYT